jgi:diguanylate cyclase (GGDEF)-like protein
VLPAELFSAGLTVGATFVAIELGTIGLVMVALVLVIFQYLVGELLTSQARGTELERLATTDTLTGLANRDRFLAEVSRAIDEGRDAFAVMLVDLDRFKEVNDTLGHHYGDELLRKLGPRLAASVPDDGLVARLGGDEFALLGPSLGDTAAAEDTAGRLIACIHEAVYVDELALEVGASIGIARYPHDGTDPNTLLRCADVAMYDAKEAHVDHRFYAPELDRHSVHKLSVLSEFRRALEHEELVVFYQPIVEVGDSRVRSAEALVRWDHPEHGLLGPGAFMPIVEQTNLIGPMTLYVLGRAIAQCASWRAHGYQLSVAVNLSVRNLLDRSLPWQIDAMLEEHGLPASALQLEITESMIMSDPERVLATVTRLNSLGIRLSVDDYGTGFSSLANLRNLPIDELKIDRSFVSPMLRDESDLIIVRSTINLGHDLGLRVIAEGVEDAATLERLGRLGCDMAQGYHMSRPLSAADCTRWLSQADAVAA